MVCFFFFKQKTAYEMRISDWSSDVCSSDLPLSPAKSARKSPLPVRKQPSSSPSIAARASASPISQPTITSEQDRKSVVWGKSGSVRVDLGGRRNIKNNNCWLSVYHGGILMRILNSTISRS